MHISSQPGLRNSMAKSKVLQALDRVNACLSDTEQARADALAAKSALDGYEPEVRAIKFDRPDRDVSAHGDNLRNKTGQCAGPSGHGLQLSNGVKEGGTDIASCIDQALKSLLSSESAARPHLEKAASDTQFLNESSMPHLTVSFRQAHQQSQEEVTPYLVEVQQDAPGRDVGRFAQDIGGLFADSISNYRQGELGGKFVVQDLTQIKASLSAARDKLK